MSTMKFDFNMFCGYKQNKKYNKAENISALLAEYMVF